MGASSSRAPQLAAFGAQRLAPVPAYLATVNDAGAPRVHPVTPVIGPRRLFLFMEPTWPKGHDIVARGVYALHRLVPEDHATGGEFYVCGRGERIDTPHVRAVAAQAASYTPQVRYVFFELPVTEARRNGYGDVVLCEPWSWRSDGS